MRRTFETCDPFVVVKSGRNWFRTLTMHKSTDPVWNLEHHLDVEDAGQEVHLMVFSNRNFIGKASFPVSAIDPFGKVHDLWIPLRDEFSDIKQLSDVDIKGYLHLCIEWKLEDVPALFYSYLQLFPQPINEMFRSSRAEVTPMLEGASIPIQAYDLVYPQKQASSLDQMRETIAAVNRHVLGPIRVMGALWKEMASWRNPALSMVFLIAYESFVFYPGTAVKYVPFVVILLLFSMRVNIDDMFDEDPPERLPVGKRRLAKTGEAADEQQKIITKKKKKIGLLAQIGRIKTTSTAVTTSTEEWVGIVTRWGNLLNWGSPSGSMLIVMIMSILFLLLLIFPLSWLLAPLPLLIFFSAKQMHPLARLMYRTPRYSQTFLVGDRLLVSSE